jgi:hypothetical protein
MRSDGDKSAWNERRVGPSRAPAGTITDQLCNNDIHDGAGCQIVRRTGRRRIGSRESSATIARNSCRHRARLCSTGTECGSSRLAALARCNRSTCSMT